MTKEEFAEKHGITLECVEQIIASHKLYFSHEATILHSVDNTITLTNKLNLLLGETGNE